jgi:glycosyltransferase involved in cell wall biosynthesis
LKVACFTPLQPVKSGISDYNEDLIPYLAEAGVDFDFIYEDLPPDNEFVVRNCEFHKHSDFPSLAASGKYDLVVYHIGNHIVHNYMYGYFFDYPGLTVLHDFVLHHSRLSHYVKSRNLNGYMKEMDAIGSYDIARIVSSGMGGEFLYYNFPVNKRVIESSRGIIVHNSYLKQVIENGYPGKEVFHIPHNAAKRPVSKNELKKLRAKMGIPVDGIVIATFGFMNEAKKINLISMALRQLMPKYRNIYYLICGEDREGVVRRDYFNYPGILERVKVSGYIEGMDRFIEYIELSDIVINLRFPSAGETSGTMIRSMAQGKPVITYDLPTLIDIPEDALARISLTDDYRQLLRILEDLIQHPEMRSEIGSNAAQYVKRELNPELNARLYKSAFEAAAAMTKL